MGEKLEGEEKYILHLSLSKCIAAGGVNEKVQRWNALYIVPSIVTFLQGPCS